MPAGSRELRSRRLLLNFGSRSCKLTCEAHSTVANMLCRECGKRRAGSIVNIGSICGIQSLPNLVAYGAAKGGLLSLTRTLAGALSDDRIRVNYVIPGWVLTEGELAIQRAQGHGEELLRKEGEKLRFGRQQKPLDAAYAVVYLLSDESSQVTGTIFHIDAGESTLPIARGMYPG